MASTLFMLNSAQRRSIAQAFILITAGVDRASNVDTAFDVGRSAGH
jgi:hypothetical protein